MSEVLFFIVVVALIVAGGFVMWLVLSLPDDGLTFVFCVIISAVIFFCVYDELPRCKNKVYFYCPEYVR